MATQYQNLSEYDPEVLPDKKKLERQQYAIAVADWNPNITYALLEGAIETLVKSGVKRNNINIRGLKCPTTT